MDGTCRNLRMDAATYQTTVLTTVLTAIVLCSLILLVPWSPPAPLVLLVLNFAIQLQVLLGHEMQIAGGTLERHRSTLLAAKTASDQ